jgi:GNAT superfamily N-acetyltransferase
MTIRAFTGTAAERSAIEDIFFLSSTTPLQGGARESFFQIWAGNYLDQMPDQCLIHEEGGKVLGYLTGCANSRDAAPLLGEIFYYAAFAEFYDAYPAHLHINIHPLARGAGVGAELVEKYLARVGAPTHVVTAVGARNRVFYERLGFETVATRRIDERDLVILGRTV